MRSIFAHSVTLKPGGPPSALLFAIGVAQVLACTSPEQRRPNGPPVAWALQQPESWDGRVTMVDLPSSKGARATRQFIYQTIDSTLDAHPLLLVAAFDSAEWPVAKSVAAGTLDSLTSVAGQVFAAKLTPDNPYPTASPDHEHFGALKLPIAEVRARFRVFSP